MTIKTTVLNQKATMSHATYYVIAETYLGNELIGKHMPLGEAIDLARATAAKKKYPIIVTTNMRIEEASYALKIQQEA